MAEFEKKILNCGEDAGALRKISLVFECNDAAFPWSAAALPRTPCA
ncbi:hypothetical protein [Aquabacterium sp.]